MVIVAVAVFVVSVTEVAVSVTSAGSEHSRCRVHHRRTRSCSLSASPFRTRRRCSRRLTIVHVTPLFCESFVTVAAKFALAPTSTLAVVGDSVTPIGGAGVVTVIPAAACFVGSDTEVAVSIDKRWTLGSRGRRVGHRHARRARCRRNRSARGSGATRSGQRPSHALVRRIVLHRRCKDRSRVDHHTNRCLRKSDRYGREHRNRGRRRLRGIRHRRGSQRTSGRVRNVRRRSVGHRSARPARCWGRSFRKPRRCNPLPQATR